MTRIRIANAPVSYGVFGDITVDSVTTPAQLLGSMAAAGYAGSEIGPPGFFGSEDQLCRAFSGASLDPVGAYVPLHTQDANAVLERDLERMDRTLDELVALGGGGLVILADEGNDALLAHPRHSREFALDGAGWERLVTVVTAAQRAAEERGLTTSFHPHISTFVEQPDEIEKLLTLTSVDVTYDVGHIVLAGGDAAKSFRDWHSRINHLHFKDVRRDVFEQAVASGRGDFDRWWSQLCTPLGQGDLDLDGFIDAVVESGFSGWAVVEQDRAVLTVDALSAVLEAQRHNFTWLAGRLGPV